MESRFNRYAIWVADSYKKYITKLLLDKTINFDNNHNISQQEIDELFMSGDEDFQTFLSTWWQGKYRDELYGFIHDWLRGRNSGAVIEDDKLDFKKMTALQAYARAADWHRKLESIQTGVIEDEYGDVVMTFPDGYYWIKLNSSKCDDEAEAMGHCGTGSSGGNLYSLRKDKKPVVTVDVLNGVVRQMRGKANTKPKKEYHKYMTDFVLSDIVKNFEYDRYKPENNFYITDLEEKDIDKIISQKPSLMKDQELDKINTRQTEELLKTTPEIFPINDIVSGDLSEENIENELKNIFIGKSELNQSTIREVLKKFVKSGEYFSKILVEKIEENNLIFEILKSNIDSNYNDSKSFIKLIKEYLPELKDHIKELFLKNKEVINLYIISKDSKSILKYLDIICLKSIFDKEGLIKALNILENPKVKEITIKETGLDYYEALCSLIKDEIS